MSSKPINNDSAFLNNTLLDLPLLRETFVAPETSTRADLYAIRKATERTLELNERDRDEKALQVYTPEVLLPEEFTISNEKVLDTMQDISYSVGEIVASNERGFLGIQEGMQEVRKGITDMAGIVHNDLGVLNQAISTIYGTNLPQNRSFKELEFEISIDGKNTALALLLAGGLDKEKSTKLFGDKVLRLLDLGLSYDEAVELSKKSYEDFYAIREQRKNLYKNKEKMHVNEFEGALSRLDHKETEARKNIFSRDELNMIKSSDSIRGKSMLELVNEGKVNPKILEVMVRNGITDGETSDKLSRIIRQDENGFITPLIELPGITGIFQQNKAQTVLQNIMVRQGSQQLQQLGEVNRNLGDINLGIQESNRSLGSIDLGIQETNRSLGDINNGIYALNGQLENIGDYLEVGNQLQEITNIALGELIVSNERVGKEIALTREVIGNILINVGEVIVSGFNALRSDLQQNTIVLADIRNLQTHSLLELYKQTETLNEIDNSLKSPGRTRADELVNEGFNCINYNFLDDALECFMDAISHFRTHLLANLGAGVTLNMIGESKEALKYLFKAEDIATKDSQNKIASISLIEQAKIFLKHLNLKKAFFVLEKAELFTPNKIEIMLLKARTLLLKKDTGLLDTQLNEIVNLILNNNLKIDLNFKNYDDILKLIEKTVEQYVNKLIDKKNLLELTKLINILENLGFINAYLSCVLYLLETDTEEIIRNNINLSEIIKLNPNGFENAYINIINNNPNILKNNLGTNAYKLAVWGYKILSFEIIENVLKIGILSDPNYLYLKRKVDEDKNRFRSKFFGGIFSIGIDAKEMLNEFMRRNPKFI